MADVVPEVVHDRAGGRAELLGQEAASVAVGDDADVVAVGLVRHGPAAGSGVGADWCSVVSPRGNMAWTSWSRVSTAST